MFSYFFFVQSVVFFVHQNTFASSSHYYTTLSIHITNNAVVPFFIFCVLFCSCVVSLSLLFFLPLYNNIVAGFRTIFSVFVSSIIWTSLLLSLLCCFCVFLFCFYVFFLVRFPARPTFPCGAVHPSLRHQPRPQGDHLGAKWRRYILASDLAYVWCFGERYHCISCLFQVKMLFTPVRYVQNTRLSVGVKDTPARILNASLGMTEFQLPQSFGHFFFCVMS